MSQLTVNIQSSKLGYKAVVYVTSQYDGIPTKPYKQRSTSRDK